jgi:hypothetical protein
LDASEEVPQMTISRHARLLILAILLPANGYASKPVPVPTAEDLDPYGLEVTPAALSTFA